MNRPLAILSFCALLSACTEEASIKDAEKAIAAEVEEDTAAAVKSEKKSIEEAADAAAKLVEEESRQEIEAMEQADTQ